MNRFMIIPLCILLFISLLFNAYFIKQEKAILPSVEQESEQKEYTVLLENEVENLRNALQSATKHNNKSSNITTLERSTDLEKHTIEFLKNIYNLTAENYSESKQLARNLMSESLFEILYPAAGLDSNNLQYTSRFGDAQIYQHSDDLQTFVKFTVITTDSETQLKSEETHMMILYFIKKNNSYLVEQIETISDLGAV